jgi:hypothetical protein
MYTKAMMIVTMEIRKDSAAPVPCFPNENEFR